MDQYAGELLVLRDVPHSIGTQGLARARMKVLAASSQFISGIRCLKRGMLLCVAVRHGVMEISLL